MRADYSSDQAGDVPCSFPSRAESRSERRDQQDSQASSRWRMNLKPSRFTSFKAIREVISVTLNFRSFYDRDLNSEQQQAVQKIVSGSSRPAPYLVFGPPGTGKTVTLVEAIKQVSSSPSWPVTSLLTKKDSLTSASYS